MIDQILFIGPETPLKSFLELSLSAEGYNVIAESSLDTASAKDAALILVDARERGKLAQLIPQIATKWTQPVILLRAETSTTPPLPASTDDNVSVLMTPFSFQDLLLIIQDTVYQNTFHGRQPFQLSPALADEITAILQDLYRNLHARCVVLSSSGGRLITSVGAIDRGTAITLAALMSGSFTASAKAAQLFGDEDMFDSSLQESEGYGLYAIRLHDSLILSVAFSDTVTAGMVRHYAAQGAIDILELLVGETEAAQSLKELELSADFRQDVNQVLGDILGE